ncbi:bone sialoprotein 2 [Neltuma alba]|uniref:bone sialoprotein 2 n=1 Tax=Neltuma alba TaxID=207710 RepID=UPI0010A504A2|nr:bone sialoprotein 2 [Prosopis alba]XP_028754744.1 bone sialoprotein 2 [Prosopis alba]
MERRSKELLRIEHKNTSFSSLESSLSFCKKDSSFVTKKLPSDGTPLTAPVAPSHLLGKVKDFLGVMSEANQRLELGAKDNPRNYDIEELTGNESEVIEMDLMLGVTDLHTPEAVAAAESAISGSQPVIPSAGDTSETDSDEASSDDDDEEEEEEEDDDESSHGEDRNGCEKDGSETCSVGERPISGEDRIISKQKRNQHPKKRPKIVELS